MTIKKNIIEVLASKRTFYFLIFTWIFVINFSNIILPPAPDDGWDLVRIILSMKGILAVLASLNGA